MKKLPLFAGLAALTLAQASAQTGFLTSIPPYLLPTAGSGYAVIPVLSSGDRVPNTGNPLAQYQMIGIPDGLGATGNEDGTVSLWMNHELVRAALSEPNVGGARNRGAFVSKFILAPDGSVLSGQRAYDTVVDVEKGLVLPAAEVGNATSAFARFCSGALGTAEHGFDRPIYFAGEESGGADTFDGKGGLEVAIIDEVLYTLPKLGRFPWENALPRPFNGNEVVIMCMEDGPSTPDSQLYMYVGKKDHRAGADVLNRNGLNNGRLYAFRSKDPAKNSEATFQTGSIWGEWVEIPNADLLTDVQLEAASDAAGAFGFVRTEDGAWSKTSRKDYFFVTTGSSYTAPGAGAPANKLGRAYQLELNPGNPLKPARLTVIYNADHVIAAGGDIAVSPDNIDVSGDYLMIQEDGTAESRPVMAAKGRMGGIWRLDLNNGFAADYVGNLTGLGRNGVQTNPGIWESSGIIDASSLFGADTWLLDVQAHSPTPAPAPNTVEDGQLLLMVPAAE